MDYHDQGKRITFDNWWRRRRGLNKSYEDSGGGGGGGFNESYEDSGVPLGRCRGLNNPMLG